MYNEITNISNGRRENNWIKAYGNDHFGLLLNSFHNSHKYYWKTACNQSVKPIKHNRCKHYKLV